LAQRINETVLLSAISAKQKPMNVECLSRRDRSLRSKRGKTVMRTDQVLTMEEFLHECCVGGARVTPPIPGARHIPVTEENDLNSAVEPNGRRCDRWGHACSDCPERKTTNA